MKRLFTLLTFIVFVFLSISVYGHAAIKTLDLQGCHPSQTYMLDKQTEYKNEKYINYSIDISQTTVDQANPAVNLDASFQCNYKRTQPCPGDCSPEMTSNAHIFWNLCSVDQAQCYFKDSTKNFNNIYVYCCPNTIIKDANGSYLTSSATDPNDPRLLDFVCENMANKDYVTNISREQFNESSCIANRDKNQCKKVDEIDGIKHESSNIFFCTKRVGQVDPNVADCCFVPTLAVESTPSFAGCDGITDAEERESCENCVWKNKATFEPTGSVWTEIGCVDPSPTGLITRAFQIGVGIMGGVAVVRIIQIAIIMQGDDAQKKQEAPGMIWGLAGGLLFLAVGLLVLKYLGINVIGLPETFLGR